MVLGRDGSNSCVLPDCLVYFKRKHNRVLWWIKEKNEKEIFNRLIAMLLDDYPISGLFKKG
jgi:hypothetical protein